MGRMKLTRRMGFVCASIIVAGATFLPMIGEARAQAVFTTIQAFGDSYADIGNVFRIAGIPNPPQYPTGRFSGGTNFIDTTSALLGIPQANFAIGGAASGATQVSNAILSRLSPERQGVFSTWKKFYLRGILL